MPKQLDYPRVSFKDSLDLMEAVGLLGGQCDKETCAAKMGLKMSGAFTARIGAAARFGLISSKTGGVALTELSDSIRNAYNDVEASKFKLQSFLTPPTFGAIFERFSNAELPVGILSKILVREYDVEENKASAVSKYFIGGLKDLGLLDGNNRINAPSIGQVEEVAIATEIDNTEDSSDSKPQTQILHIESTQVKNEIVSKESNEFAIRITGPGIDSQIVVREEDDLLIVEAMLNKVKKKL